MRNKAIGFTLIELIIVVVILGILAAIAIPKYIDLKSDSQTASTTGVASALASASAVNYTSRKENSSNGVAVANCTAVASALQGGLPSGYTITAGAIAADATATCTVNGPNSTTATFSATGIA